MKQRYKKKPWIKQKNKKQKIKHWVHIDDFKKQLTQIFYQQT